MTVAPTPDRLNVLTPGQREAYARDGYVVVDDVLTADELGAVNELVDELIERSRRATESDDVFDLEPGHRADAPRLRRIKEGPRLRAVDQRRRLHGGDRPRRQR